MADEKDKIRLDGPMSYDYFRKITAADKIAAKRHAKELHRKLMEAEKRAEEEYESSKR